MNRAFDVASSVGASLFRLGAGLAVGPLGKRPAQPLELWSFEASPFCRMYLEATYGRP